MYWRTIRRRELDAELQQQFVGDALLVPAGSLVGHAPNEVLQLSWNGRSTRAALQTPQQLPGAAVTAKQRLRANDHQGAAPIEEPGQQHQTNPGDRIDSTRLDTPFDI